MRRGLRETGSVGSVSHGVRVWIALGTVYLLWGSTYLGIELTGEAVPLAEQANARMLSFIRSAVTR